MKEEIIGGSHSLEARYPFLDKQVVQEYIWLSAEAKNEIYKRPVRDYMKKHGYPFEDGVKSGFSASKNLLLYGKRRTDTLFDSLDGHEHAHARLRGVADFDGEETDMNVVERDVMTECSDIWMQVRSALTVSLLWPRLRTTQFCNFTNMELKRNMELDRNQCSYGLVSVDLFELLRGVITHREESREEIAFIVNAKHESWMMFLHHPWTTWFQSGWPIFGILKAITNTHGYTAMSCESLEGEEVLRPKLDVIKIMEEPSEALLNDLQSAFWLVVEPPLNSVDRALRSCILPELIHELDQISKRFARVNWVDAYPLLKDNSEFFANPPWSEQKSFRNFAISY
jgi:hypothetical protein